MSGRSPVVPLQHPDAIDDPLTVVLRSGARRLLMQAVEAEAEAFLATMKSQHLPDGRERVVRHGHGPERLVQTGIGPVAAVIAPATFSVDRSRSAVKRSMIAQRLVPDSRVNWSSVMPTQILRATVTTSSSSSSSACLPV